MISKLLKTWVSILALTVPLLSAAAPFSSIYVFGDSLSDTGNLFQTPDGRGFPFIGPYDAGRFSNGPLWVEYLASGLGLSGQASSYLTGGHNFAYAGAQTGGIPAAPELPIPGVLAQLTGIWGPLTTGNPPPTLGAADPNALYVVVAGGNDMRAARSAVGADSASLNLAAQGAIGNLATTLALLAASGAKNVLVSTLPDLGYTPEAALFGLQAISSEATADFNALIPTLMGAGASFGLNVKLLDMFGISNAILTNPSAYGITNLSLPCAGFALSDIAGLATSCDASAFADVLHPSAKVHAIFGHEALVAFGLPEPGSLALFAVAIAALAFAGRRRARIAAKV